MMENHRGVDPFLDKVSFRFCILTLKVAPMKNEIVIFRVETYGESGMTYSLLAPSGVDGYI